jgi:hypothetical protein
VTAWTKYVHDDVPAFGALPDGICVRWEDQRDHGNIDDGWTGLLDRNVIVWMPTAARALRLAQAMEGAGMSDVHIVCATEDEASDVVDSAFKLIGFGSVETCFDERSGWWLVSLT